MTADEVKALKSQSRLSDESAEGECQQCGQTQAALQVWYTPMPPNRLERGAFCGEGCFSKHWDIVATIVHNVSYGQD